MLSLFDMLNNAQNGGAINQMARQFGLSSKQVEDAVAALTPAFSQGLKRNTANPNDLGNFLNALSSGQHAKYFEDATAAFSGQGLEEGNGILGHLFGSKDLSRAVAAQASQATGIGQQVLQQMLPALASMIMGGLFKQSTGQLGSGGSSNPLQDILGQMMKQGGFGQGQGQAAQPQQGTPQANPLDNPFGKILEGMFGGGGAGQAQTQTQTQSQANPQNPFGDNPLGKIFGEMLGAGQQKSAPAQPEAAPEAKQQTNPSDRPRTPYDDLFGNMLEAGARGRDDYQKGMESIFDQFLQGMDNNKRR